MPITPEEAVTLFREKARILDALSATLLSRSSAMVEPSSMANVVDELLAFASELAAACAQTNRVTARIIDTLSAVTTFDVYCVDEMNLPKEEIVLDDMTESLQSPPFDADFFSGNHLLSDDPPNSGSPMD